MPSLMRRRECDSRRREWKSRQLSLLDVCERKSLLVSLARKETKEKIDEKAKNR
jgi:hypothetical protein